MAISPSGRKDAINLSNYRDSVSPTLPLTKAKKSEPLYDTAFDETYGVFWAHLRPTSPQKFTPKLLSALRQGQLDLEARIRQELAVKHANRVHYQVFASRISKVFSLGGDLEFFLSAIKSQDRQALTTYARDCVDLIYTNLINYNLPITTISLVQGAALGGGFEAALAANVVVAERQSKMGLPETMLNMFPGMGAYQLLARRFTPAQAERFILSGHIHRAEELYEMGLVDVLAEEGGGEQAVWDYIKRHHKQAHGRYGLRRAIQAVSPIRYGGLLETVDIWVDTMLGLDNKDLRRISYVARAHRQKTSYTD